MQIIDLLYNTARQHKLVKGFRYGKPSEKGAGSDAYPLVWVDDPFNGQTLSNAVIKLGVIRDSVNVDFLGLPTDDTDVLNVQKAAFMTALSFAEKIKSTPGFGVDGFSYITLREYYDDNAAGVRFTFFITGANPINLCGDFFDPDKQLITAQLLPEFSTKHPDGCAVFNDKSTLPNFVV